MSNVFQSAKFSDQVQNSSHIETFHVGDSVTVDTKIQEGDKTRTQKYKGIVIKISGRGPGKTFTVRHIGPMNVGVERIFPFISPWITGVKVEKQGHVRRAKLYYLRDRIGRKARNIRARKSQ